MSPFSTNSILLIMASLTHTTMTESQRLEQAADWLDRIDEFNEQDKQAFACWLNDNDNREAFNRMAKALGQPEIQMAARQLHQQEIQAQTNVVSLRKSVWLKATLATAATLAMFAILPSLTDSLNNSSPVAQPVPTQAASWHNQQAHFGTAIGENRSANLVDGSIVYLNGDSTLEVNHNEALREVSLTSGQAYFDVAHEPQRPFIVELGNASVRVVGTAFDIDRLADKTEIRVYEGIVSVRAGKTLMLHKGEGAVLQAGHWQRTFKLDDAALPQWRTGWLEVNNQALMELVMRLNRHIRKPIRINGDATLPVSGRFNLKAPEQALQLLNAMDDLTLTEMDDYYQLSVTL
ncbi:FecR family protein [Alteromonas lipolytica]|uniref:Uncharacterized protein n=1 Tax=Alteromonas lipolytica TaxID=1856405 RepID=A0A1E8F8N2_9ALTE|nr:FecR domain-containing protein [Alteromonas lipolytica]OFI32277.1 hypothetical protein BFC17_07445 [Alteromonas lipolytica]GGF85857.1 transcriptional regulator [Alteromonas lipolytica]